MIVLMATDRRARQPAVAGVALVALAVLALVVAGCGGGHKTVTHKPSTPTTAGTTTTTFTFVPPSSPSGPGQATTTAPAKKVPRTIPRTPPTTTSTATAGAEQAALTRLVATFPPRTSVTSTILHTGSLTYVAVGHDVGLMSLIDIYVYQGSRFVDVAPNIGSTQSLDPVDPTVIRTGNITGAPFPDLLVPLVAGDHDNGVLVSYVGGSWQLIGVSERTGAAASDELVEPNIIGNEVTQSVDDCAPDCAHGTYSVTTYVFNPQLSKLQAFGPTVQTPSA